MQTLPAEAVDVILRDGAHAPAARRPGGTTPRRCSRSSAASPSGACTSASTASRHVGRAARRAVARPRLDASAAALLGTLADDGGERVVAVGELRAPARPRRGGGRVRGRRRAAGPRHRHAPARAARRARRARPGSSASSPRCCPTTAPMLGVFEAAGFELAREPSRAARSRSSSRSRRRERYLRARRRARPRRRDGLAAAVLRAASVAVIGASPRRGLDRRRALPQHPRRRLRRRRLPGQPRRRAGRGRARLPLDRRDPRAGRPRGHLPAGRAPCSTPPRRRSRTGVRALFVISAGFAEIGSEGRGAAGARCSRSCARTAPG